MAKKGRSDYPESKKQNYKKLQMHVTTFMLLTISELPNQPTRWMAVSLKLARLISAQFVVTFPFYWSRTMLPTPTYRWYCNYWFLISCQLNWLSDKSTFYFQNVHGASLVITEEPTIGPHNVNTGKRKLHNGCKKRSRSNNWQEPIPTNETEFGISASNIDRNALHIRCFIHKFKHTIDKNWDKKEDSQLRQNDQTGRHVLFSQYI